MGIVTSTWMPDLIRTSGGSTIPVAMLDAVDHIRTMSMVWLDMVGTAVVVSATSFEGPHILELDGRRAHVALCSIKPRLEFGLEIVVRDSHQLEMALLQLAPVSFDSSVLLRSSLTVQLSNRRVEVP